MCRWVIKGRNWGITEFVNLELSRNDKGATNLAQMRYLHLNTAEITITKTTEYTTTTTILNTISAATFTKAEDIKIQFEEMFRR